MLKKISVKNLKVGHYVEKLDHGWFSTPFLFHHFKVKSEKDIKKLIDNDIHEVYINPEKGPDIDTNDIIKAPANVPANYINISMETLLVNTIIPFNLYCKKGGEYTLCLKNNLPLHPEVFYNIKECCIEDLYIDAKEKPILEKYCRDIQKEKELSKKGLAKGFETTEKVRTYNDYLNNYMPINPVVLIPGLKIPFALFIEKDTKVSKILDADETFDEAKLKRFTDDYIKANLLISIDKKDREKYKLFISELTVKKLPRHCIKEEMHIAIIKENTKIVTKDLMDNPRSGKQLKEAKETVGQMIETIIENPHSFYNLMRINSHDYYTYIHSVNVSTLSIGIGMSIGLKKDTELLDLAFGALLHDVGKSMIDSAIINKPGKLTDTEFKVMKEHVLLGERLLRKHKNLPEIIFYPLLQHHERLSGSGYPNGLRRNEIHTFGRISAIADVYDAMTTERAYKKAFTTFNALNYLAKNVSDYDQDIFKHFIVMLGDQEINK